MRESEIQSEDHRSHALEWRSEDTCLLCLMEVIRADSGTRMRIHRRFALATFIQKLNLDVTRPSASQRESLSSSRSLAKLLQKNSNVSSQVLNTLLDALTVVDLVDLAVDAVYQFYHKILRDDTVLDTVLTHSLQKIGESLSQPEKWVPYLSVLQRLVLLVPSAVALALSQNAKLENEIVEHLSDHFNEFVALHIIVLVDPIIRSDERIFPKANRRPVLMLQIARLLQSAQCQQLQLAVLALALVLWIKPDFNQVMRDATQVEQLIVATVNGLKRIILHQNGLPEMQVAALQVLDSLLAQCGDQQVTGGPAIVNRLLEEQDIAELMYDMLYGSHLPLLEYALRCLHHLSQCPSFFQHRWIILGVEPLVRVIPHLAGSNSSGGMIVTYAIHLLSDMLSKYRGEESILINGGFDAVCSIANMALASGAHPLETGGTCLVAALLDQKNLPVPAPIERLLHLIRSCLSWLLAVPQSRKWRSESGRIHLRAVIRMLSTGSELIVYLTDNARARVSSYATTPMDDDDADQVASFGSDRSLDTMIELIITTVDQLISIVQQVDEDVVWSEFLILLKQLATSSMAGSDYVDKTLKTAALLPVCFHRRASTTSNAADALLTWFLARHLHQGNWLVMANAPLASTLASLVALIPNRIEQLADWLAPDNKRAPFGAKCAALVLLHQLELHWTFKEGDDVLFVGKDHCDAIVSSIGELMLTRSPCDMDDVDLLRSIWFLIAKYSQYGSALEASKAFVHLVKWFQPNGGLLLAWLRRIYTPHLCLMRWAFASNDIASYIGSYMVLLWIDDTVDDEKNGQLMQLCLQPTRDGHLLLLSIFELSFDERVGSTAAALLQTAAESSDAVRLVIGRMIKYNIPRFLRLTDVTDDANYARLVGSLRLLCRLSSNRPTSDIDDGATSWKDPSIVAALVSFLPRTIRPTEEQREEQQLKLGTMELWSWGCRYLRTVLTVGVETASHRAVATEMILENRIFLDFVDQIFRRDQLPVWNQVAGLVASLAAFHHLHDLKVVSRIGVSLNRLARRLTTGLVAADGDAAESLDVIVQLIGTYMETDGVGLLEDASMTDGCSDELRRLLHHLWATLLNWTMRVDAAQRDRLFDSLERLMRFVAKTLPTDNGWLASQPWNFIVVMDAVESSASAVHLARQLIKESHHGTPWSKRLEERLQRHAQHSS